MINGDMSYSDKRVCTLMNPFENFFLTLSLCPQVVQEIVLSSNFFLSNLPDFYHHSYDYFIFIKAKLQATFLLINPYVCIYLAFVFEFQRSLGTNFFFIPSFLYHLFRNLFYDVKKSWLNLR